MTFEEEKYQRLCLSLVELSDYCRNHQCNLECDFFIIGRGCILQSGKPAKHWFIPATIIKGMKCEELKPVVIEEEQNNESIRKGDGDAT